MTDIYDDLTIPAYIDREGDFWVRREDDLETFDLYWSDGLRSNNTWTADDVEHMRGEPWYGLIPGLTIDEQVGSSKPEPVLTPEQWEAVKDPTLPPNHVRFGDSEPIDLSDYLDTDDGDSNWRDEGIGDDDGFDFDKADDGDAFLYEPDYESCDCVGDCPAVTVSEVEALAFVPSAEEVPPRAALLREAADLITGDRNKTYGSPTQNFSNTAELWTTLLRHKLKDGEVVEPYEVGTLMVALKLARTVAQPKRDNFTDASGYAACAWEALAEAKGLDPNG